ncbi:MAG: hypothetical protein C5B52_05125 [Bacteroidetes bacterium]|nr:MAG: hypothetical protein C5B52_05125 [Bacteroidota bacterium]
MKKIILALSCFVIVSLGQSQTTPPYKYLGNYTQPAPNVGALGKYADYPVSYYTGTPNISIPLYNLQDGAAKLSVSLSYHASGIRVSELASWVGLGWALNAGGMIARTVRGGPDEGIAAPGGSPSGYYQDSGIRKMPMLNYPNSSGVMVNLTPQFEYFKQQLSAGKMDTEPDLFTFNFNGYTGKFVFDESRTPRMITEEDVKISVAYDGSNFTSWLITTPDGTRYYFGENNMHEVTAVTSNQTTTDFNTQKPSSWFLTRIIYPNTKDTVYFNYTTEAFSYYDLGQETKIFGGSGDVNMTQACTIIDPPMTIYKTTVTGLKLNNITSRNFNIKFIANTARQDLVGSSNQLDSVKIFNAQNQCIKQYLLSYSYFKSTTAANLPTGAAGYMGGDTSDTKRLKLLSVREISGDGLSTKPPYSFTYLENKQLPRRMSYDQDHWGYSNNYSGNSNKRFTPHVYNQICLNTNGEAANRNADTLSMKSFTIRTIKDPLGVTTTLDFEAHTSTQGSPFQFVGGLRIKKITTQDSLTSNVQVRSFDYGRGGVLYHTPQYLLFPQNEFYYTINWLFSGPTVSYQGYGFGPVYLRCAVRESQSVVPLQDFQGNPIGYPFVKETFGPSGEGGYKMYSYMADQFFNNTSRLSMYNYTGYTTVQSDYGPVTGYFGNGHFNDTLPQYLEYYFGGLLPDLYPAAPDQLDFRRGQQLGEDTYDSSGVLLRKVRNVFSEKYHEDYSIRGFKLFRHQNQTALYDDAMTFYKLRTGISHLVSTIITDYKDSKSMVTTHTYGYENDAHSLRTSDTTTNSVGDVMISKNYYSFDYTNTASSDSVFAKMSSRNMLLPIATRVWKNNQLIGGTITQYKDFATSGVDTFINPVKIYALETTVPLTQTQVGENVGFSSKYTTLLPSSYFVEKANFNVNGSTGKITDQKLVNDKNQAIIWDNNLNLPLAQVDNATFQDVAFNSFESPEKGNWNYTASAVVSDATAPTGAKAISLSSSSLSKSSLTSGKSYIVSYWKKSGSSVSISGGTTSNAITGRTVNGYQYNEVAVTGATTITVSGSGNIDEVSLYPANAQMSTYTYDSLMRLIAIVSVNGTICYYDYDSFNRLLDIKDQYGNIRKVFEYNYGELSR